VPAADIPEEHLAWARRLRDARGGGRTQVLKGFALLAPALAARVLRSLWDEDAPAARSAAVEALGTRPDAACDEFDDRLWKGFAHDSDPERRGAALEAAARQQGPRVAEFLALWADDPLPGLRRRALTLLLVGNLPGNACARKRLEDDDPAVRLQAIRLAARDPGPATVPGLWEKTRSRDARERREALEALERHHPLLALAAAAGLIRNGDPEAVPDAHKLLLPYDPPRLGQIVLEGLAAYPADFPALETESLSVLLESVSADVRDALSRRDGPDWLAAALIACEGRGSPGDSRAVARLMRLSHRPSPELRARAVAAMEHHDAEEPGTVLGPLLRHPHADVRQLAIAGLGRAGPPALRLLQRFLSDGDPALRRATYEALAELLPEDAVGVWSRGLKDPDEAVRHWAVERLAALPDGPEARAALTNAACGADAVVRNAAVRALLAREVSAPELAIPYRDALVEALSASGEPFFKPPEQLALTQAVAALAPYNYIAVLVQAAQAKSAIVRRAAAEVIFSRPARGQAREAMAMLAATEDPDVLRRVALRLAEVRDPRGLVPLLRALDECPGARGALEPLLEHYPQVRQLRFLFRALKEPFPSIKRFALRALLDLDSPEMIEPLLQATRDPDPEVQQRALQALAKFAKHPEVYRRLMEIRDTQGDGRVKEEAVATILGLDSPKLIPQLIEATRESDAEVQFAAVQALGKFAARPEVKQRLIEILDYGDIAVREKAMQVLGEQKVKEAVDPLIRFLGNPFLGFRAREALFQIGERKGVLAIKRHALRSRLYGKKKEKGPIQAVMRKGKGQARRAGKERRKA
jgi:HEAT repeat protein